MNDDHDNVRRLPTLEDRAARRQMAKAAIMELTMDERWMEIIETVQALMAEYPPQATPEARLSDWQVVRDDVSQRIARALDLPPEQPMSRVSSYYGQVRVRGGKLRIIDAEADKSERGVEIDVDPERHAYHVYDGSFDFGGGRVAVAVAITEAPPTAAMRTAHDRRIR